ncbi:MAG: SIMPL domain-containing protein [Candidatus Pacebacteria bacterium]|nr:SIMPL domain-containing protein [Candidatus Paceibacterota bacterium]
MCADEKMFPMVEAQNPQTQAREEIKRNQFWPVLFPVIVLVGAFLTVLIVSNVIKIKNELSQGENTFTVTGSGEIYATPDIAMVNFGIVTESPSVVEAMSKNTNSMNTLIASLKEQGVEEKDLKTTSFTIYPRYEWEEKTVLYPGGKRTLAGYEVRQTLQTKIRNMDNVGNIVLRGTKAGANEVSELQFLIDKEDELKKQAREKAIESAKAKASELASQLGFKLLRVSNFSENGTIPYFYGYRSSVEADTSGVVPEIATGENKVEVNVTITYEIK